ncbi:MAG: signal peptidase I [Alistipes sp.]
MNKIKSFFANRWVGFILASLLYTLWFVVWTGNLWLLLGLIVLFDLYITRFFYRYIWSHNARFCKNSKTYKFIYEWINAIVFATVVASLIHLFVFQMYVIPTSSMEKSLLIGDYLYVSKVAYGPQMPNTPIAFPFVHHTMPFSQTKRSFSEIIKWPYHRLKGLGQIKRNDVVVFNFPAGDTVLLENQAVTYYDVLRDYQQQFGVEGGRHRLFEDFTVIARPVDKRENYIKRCVAIPGDSLQVINAEVYINGVQQETLPNKQYFYTVQTSSPLTSYALENLEVTEYNNNGAAYYMALTEEKVAKIRQLDNVIDVRRYVVEEVNPDVFPQQPNLYPWSQDQYGPIWIPQKGSTVTLTMENLPLYERIIQVYEANDLAIREGQIYINGEPTNHYTFKMNYYWMMGDNRHNSADSRFWGFVPEDHIVGKASFVWLSLDSNKSFPSNIRWNRLFSSVK